MRRRDKVKTKKEIVNAAAEEFTSQGFLKASTIAIARKAHVAHATLFFHFPTKSDLIIECIYHVLSDLADSLHQKSRNLENIRSLCTLYIDEVQKKAQFYSHLVKDLPLLPLDIQREVFASLSGFSVHFVDVLEEAQRVGKARNFSSKIAMFYWFGMINYLYSYPKLLGTINLSVDDKKEIISFFTQAIKR
jgi:AcrR family transcriptional regulator